MPTLVKDENGGLALLEVLVELLKVSADKSMSDPAVVLLRFFPAKTRVKLSPADMLKILREKNELTQAELAKRTKLTQATISTIESGRVKLGVERTKVLARALHVHPAVLVFAGWDIENESAA